MIANLRWTILNFKLLSFECFFYGWHFTCSDTWTLWTEAYSEPSQRSKIELFPKTINAFRRFRKKPHLRCFNGSWMHLWWSNIILSWLVKWFSYSLKSSLKQYIGSNIDYFIKCSRKKESSSFQWFCVTCYILQGDKFVVDIGILTHIILILPFFATVFSILLSVFVYSGDIKRNRISSGQTELHIVNIEVPYRSKVLSRKTFFT